MGQPALCINKSGKTNALKFVAETDAEPSFILVRIYGVIHCYLVVKAGGECEVIAEVEVGGHTEYGI